jgi:Fe-S oxidoreductase
MDPRLERHAEALTLCTYCPSLCLHTCPVSTVEARDSVSPWGKMSLANHVRTGAIRLTAQVASVFYKCMGCRACSASCAHTNDVESALFAARQLAVAEGVAPYPRGPFAHADLSGIQGPLAQARKRSRYRAHPECLLLPGHRTHERLPGAVDALLDLCDRFDDDELCLGEASAIDAGYDLLAAGYLADFLDQARRFARAISAARRVVVMSPETAYALKVWYPRHGITIDAEVQHTAEYLLPMLSGATVRRIEAPVVYHDNCHLARHLGGAGVVRELLKRVLAAPPVELAQRGEHTACCGATGCFEATSPGSARRAAELVVELVLEQGGERLVSASPECVALLREVAPPELAVSSLEMLLREAVVG